MSFNLSRRDLMAIAAGAAGAALLPGRALAQSTEERGRAIGRRSDRSDNGFHDSVVALTMTLRNANGVESTRQLEIRTLERASEEVGDKSLVIFSSPADIDGTALLSHARLTEPDDQWIYLPALRRVRRIASVNKSGPFVGSEFAFEDFTAQEFGKFRYNYLRAEERDGLACDVIERFPLYQHSGYTRQIAWIDQQAFQVRRLEFFDRGQHHLKTLTLGQYQRYDNTGWRACRLHMENHLNRKSTTLQFGQFRFRTGLTNADFVPGILPTLS